MTYSPSCSARIPVARGIQRRDQPRQSMMEEVRRRREGDETTPEQVNIKDTTTEDNRMEYTGLPSFLPSVRPSLGRPKPRLPAVSRCGMNLI